MNRRAFLGLVLVSAACRSDPGEVDISLVWSGEAPSFPREVYLAARIEASGAIVQEILPHRYSMAEALDFEVLPADRELTLIAEVRDGAFRNSGALYYAISAPFQISAGEKSEVVATFQPGPAPFAVPPGPPPPPLEKLQRVETPAGIRVIVEEGAAPAGSAVLIYGGTDVASSAELARMPMPANGRMEMDLGAIDPLQPICAAVLGADDLLSDASAELPGLQAILIERTVAELPPAKTVYRTAIVSEARDPPEYARVSAEQGADAMFHAPAMPTWHPRANAVRGPKARFGAAATYDAARGQVFLYGGYDDAPLGDVWIHDGDRWIDHTPIPAGPGARFDHALAYDAARESVLLFGGENGDVVFGDLWAWEDLDWRAIDVGGSGPPPRRRHMMAYDAERGRVVLFGGIDSVGAMLGDTWLWDGEHWSRSGEGPKRSEAAFSFDRRRGRVVMFGGRSESGVENDLWSFDGEHWAEEEITGDPPPPRARAAWVEDRPRERMVLFGGIGEREDALGDLWELAGSEWQLGSEHGPSARGETAAAYDRAHGVLLMFGGRNAGPLGDTWAWDGTRFEERTPTLLAGPDPLHNHTMAFDRDRGRAVIFGGSSGQLGTENGVWEWDQRGWYSRGDGGAVWKQHEIAYDSRRKVMVAFGGEPPETLEWVGDHWVDKTPAATPAGRRGHRLAFDARRGVTVLFGGRRDPFAWDWNGLTWSPTRNLAPAELERHTMIYHPELERVLVYGGNHAMLLNAAMYSFDGVRWSDISGTPEFARAGAVMAYAESRDRLLLFGGENVTSANEQVALTSDVHVWRDDAWVRIEPSGPVPTRRSEHRMVYDPGHERMVMYGGVEGFFGPTLGDLWTLDMPLGQKASIDVGVELDAMLPRGAEIESIELAVNAGGRGSPEGAPLALATGSVLLLWNVVRAEFVELASNEADLETPEMLEATVRERAAAFVDVHRKLTVRIASRHGAGAQVIDAEVAAGVLAVRVSAKWSGVE